MVSHLLFYQLELIALVCLFLMLYGLWPSAPAAARPMTPKPLLPRCTHSKKPKPFPGLTRQPCCAACEQVSEAPRLPAISSSTPDDDFDPRPPPSRRHLASFLSRSRLSLWGLARAGQYYGQRASQWRPLATTLLQPLFRTTHVSLSNFWVPIQSLYTGGDYATLVSP